jgi:hypothetical protein
MVGLLVDPRLAQILRRKGRGGGFRRAVVILPPGCYHEANESDG